MSGAISPAEVPQFTNRLARVTEEVRVKKEKEGRDTGDRLELTEWKYERPNLSLDYSCALRNSHELVTISTLENVPHSSQEFVILEELLKVFCGGESDFIKVHEQSDRHGKREYVISPTIDTLNADLIKKCLPMASLFSIVSKFVEENGRLAAGRVNQALAEAMDRQLMEYISFIESLESKNRRKLLHLHELWFHIQKFFSTLKILSGIALEVTAAKMRGGRTLSLLHDQLLKLIAPDNFALNLYLSLTAHSSAPYMESVKQWIFNGIIYDPFDEFMIYENPKWKNKGYSEGYWEMKYQVRPHLTPNFLEDVQYYILNSGKYLNVIRECVKSEKNINLAPIEDLKYSEERLYSAVIMKAYNHSSKILLSYMLNEFNLMERISTAKKYFLLQQGDFVVQLLDTCHEELEKDVNEVMPSRLAALVEMAIRPSSTRADTFTEQFTSCLKPIDLGSQVKKILVDCIPGRIKDDQDSSTVSDKGESLSGYESFMLTMKCEWPISLVFNSKVQSVYQMLFRHLFYCKYVERLLSNSWVLGQSIRDLNYNEMKPFCAAIDLRIRMNFFLQNMEYYMMEEAIEPAWEGFLEVVKNCESIDDLMKYHWNFLEKCTQDCLLTNLELLSVFRHILDLCKELGVFLCEMKSLKDSIKFPVFPDRIAYLEGQFNDSLLLFFSKITHLVESDSTGKLLSLFHRQNSNNLYSNVLNDIDMDSLMGSLQNFHY